MRSLECLTRIGSLSFAQWSESAQFVGVALVLAQRVGWLAGEQPPLPVHVGDAPRQFRERLHLHGLRSGWMRQLRHRERYSLASLR